MNNKLRSVIIGGVVLGLLSGIPYVRLGNVLCCLWIVVGGALASYVYIKKSPTPVGVGDGVGLGALAGLFGKLVEVIVGIPLTILTGYSEINFLAGLVERASPELAYRLQHEVEARMSMSFAEQFFSTVFSLETLLSLLITVVFALIGGLVAVPLFEKRRADAGVGPPPPPPYFGDPGAGPTSGGAYPTPPPPPGGYGPEA